MGITVLIAEDDENDAALLMRAVKKVDIEANVHIAVDGEQTINYMKGEGRYSDRTLYPFPRVLITDLKMPRKSGFEVLQWLKEHPECNVVPVMVFSSSKETTDVKRCYQLGANAYFQKPGTFADLVSLVKTNFEFWIRAEVPPIGFEHKCS